MQLLGLSRLDAEMKTARVLRRQWDWKNGRGHFRVLYLRDVGDSFGPYPGFTDRNGDPVYPYSVLQFVDANSSFSFHKLVSGRFKINERMDGDIGALYEALGIDRGTGGQPFSIKHFFEDFDTRIPALANTWPPRIGDSPIPRNVPEPDRRYFPRINPPGERRRPSPENLLKSRVMISDQLANYCAKNGMSSYWTDIPNDLTAEDIHRLHDF